MKKLLFLFSLMVLCTIKGSDSADHTVEQLGGVVHARVGAWASLCLGAAAGSYITYKTFEQGLCKGLQYTPIMSDARRARLATVLSATVMAPLSIVACMKYGKLFWYFFYIIYAGERISPLLARRALNDLQTYIQHLNTIKQVQKELKALITQIDQATDGLTKSDMGKVDPFMLAALESIVVVNNQYVLEVLEKLQEFFTEDDSEVQAVLSLIKRGKPSIATGMQEHAQAVVEHLQRPEDLGYDAALLNLLVKELIEYWQNYTVGLASGIDVALRTCHCVHGIEQFVVTILDRPLEFV